MVPTQIFSPKKIFFQFFGVKFFFYIFYYATFQCGRYSIFKKIWKKNDPEKVKKRASKVAHNRPRPFYFTVQLRPQPTAQNWFFILSPDQTSVLLSVVPVNRLTIRIHWHGQLRPNGLNFFRKEHSHFYSSATLWDMYFTLISNVKVENMYCKNQDI